jgi:hypothetical protein
MTTVLNSARMFVTSVAVAAVAVTMGSAAIGSPAASHQTGVSQATKEWKGSPAANANVVLATKEWKVATPILKPSPKEW